VREGTVEKSCSELLEVTTIFPQTTPIDHQTQLESLLHTVWELEHSWRNEDRIDLVVRQAAPDTEPPPDPEAGILAR
jgi:hypothetical protein